MLRRCGLTEQHCVGHLAPPCALKQHSSGPLLPQIRWNTHRLYIINPYMNIVSKLYKGGTAALYSTKQLSSFASSADLFELVGVTIKVRPLTLPPPKKALSSSVMEGYVWLYTHQAVNKVSTPSLKMNKPAKWEKLWPCISSGWISCIQNVAHKSSRQPFAL